MKKIQKSILKYFSCVKLYLDDLEEILQILKDEGFTNIKVQLTDYELEEKEIKEQIKHLSEKEVSHIKISCSNPFYISFEINSGVSLLGGVMIYCSEDSTKALGVIEKIKEILKENKRTLITGLTSSTSFIIIFFGGNILIQIIYYRIHSRSLFYFSLITWILLIIIMFMLSKKNNLIIFDLKKDRPNFWIRNKDKIIVSVITSIITITLTALITYYFK